MQITLTPEQASRWALVITNSYCTDKYYLNPQNFILNSTGNSNISKDTKYVRVRARHQEYVHLIEWCYKK